MYCEKCGHKMNDADVFCEKCGHKVGEKIDASTKSEKEAEYKPQLLNETQDKEFDPYAVTGQEISNDRTDSVNKKNNIVEGSDNVSNNIASQTAESSQNFSVDNSNNVKTIRINKKALIAVCVALAVLIVGTFTGFKIYNSVPINIDMSDYISDDIITDDESAQYWADKEASYGEDADYSLGDYNSEGYSTYEVGAGLNVTGYNGYALTDEYYLRTIVDWDSLVSDVNAQLQKKKKVKGNKLTFYDFVYDSERFDFSVDKNENIKNGDKINVTVGSYSYEIDGITVNFNGCTHTYNVDGLKVVKAFDPFDYVKMMIYNPVNGAASIKVNVKSGLKEKIASAPEFVVAYYDDSTISIQKNNSIIAKISFYFSEDDESRNDFQNGEKATMYYEIDTSTLTDDYGLYIGRESKDFDIHDLGEYASMTTKFSKDQIKNFRKAAVKTLKSYMNEDDFKTLEFTQAYLADLKDKSSSSDHYNSLCLVFSYSYSWFDDVEIAYAVVRFDNIIVDPDGSIPFTPAEYYVSENTGYDNQDDYVNSYFGEDYNLITVG